MLAPFSSCPGQVLGTAINNNGSDVTLYKPSGKLQQQCIRNAFLSAGRDPREVDYVELHITGGLFPTEPDTFFLTWYPHVQVRRSGTRSRRTLQERFSTEMTTSSLGVSREI